MAFTMLIVFIGHWVWTSVVFYSVCSIYGVLALYIWHLGLIMFSLCIFLHAQRTWVPPGLVYRDSGFSQP